MILSRKTVFLRSTIRSILFLVLLVIGLLWSIHREEMSLPSFLASGGEATLDLAQDIAVDSEGNVYVTGYSYGLKTDFDFVTLKYDIQGNLVWADRYNGPANSTDFAQALEVDQEGNVYVAGHSNGIDTSLDATLIKYDKDGEKLWVARYDGPAKRDDWAYELRCDSIRRVVVAGYSFGQGTEHDYLVLTYNSNGKLLWTARHNPPRNRDDVCEVLAVDREGNVYVTGIDRTRKTAYDMATLMYDAQGQLKWLARYAGLGQVFDAAEAIGVDTQGNVYVTGYSYSEETEYDFVTIKYDTEGQERWAVKYDGPSHLIDRGLVLAVYPGGGVCVAGTSLDQETAADCLIIHYDEEGNQVWSARFNGTGDGADVPQTIVMDTESNVIVAGYSRGQKTGRDYFVIKYDARGRQLWLQRYDGPASQEDVATAMVLDSKGYIYVTGYSHGGETDFDYATLKYSPDGQLKWQALYRGN